MVQPDQYSWIPPPDYGWPATEDKWELGVCGVQRLDVDTWPEVIEKEKASGTDLLIAMPHLPRPREGGGCECEVRVVTVLPNYRLVPTPFSVAAGFNLIPTSAATRVHVTALRMMMADPSAFNRSTAGTENNIRVETKVVVTA